MFAPSSNRQRQTYLWTRFTNARETQKNIVLHEKPNRAILKILLDMNGDMPEIKDSRDMLVKYLKMANDFAGDVKATYTQNDYSEFAPPSYKGSVKLGRSYPKLAACYMPSIVANTMWKMTHVELDIKASFPTMLVSIFRNLDLPFLSQYSRDSTLIVNEASRSLGLGKADIKKIVNAAICAYPTYAKDLGVSGLEQDQLDEIRHHRFFVDLDKDLKSIAEFVEEHYPDFMEMVKNKCKADKKGRGLKHVVGVALSYFAGDAENLVMRRVLRYLKRLDPELYDDMVWKFDGLLVNEEKLGNALESLEDLSTYVLNKTGITVQFAKKPPQNVIQLCVAPQELDMLSRYDRWKTGFENEYALFKKPAGYVRMWPEGVQHLTKGEFDIMVAVEDQEMIKRWKADPDRRTFIGQSFSPPPLPLEEGYYNTWKGFDAERIPEPEEPVDLKPYMDHVSLLMGGDEAAIDYMHKLLAFKFQNPGELWRVMVFIRSPQGVGKDIWLDFLFSVVGKQYGVRLSKVGDLAGQYNSLMENKLFVGFSEMDPKDCYENMDSLKDMITCERVSIKKKYVASYDTNNSACFIGFSNNFNAIKVTADDRRVFSVTASGRYANKPEYHLPLIAFLKRQDVKRAVFDYYMNLDIGDFNPSGDRPVTETMLDMRDDSLGAGDVFVKSHFHLWLRQARGRFDGISLIEDGYMKIPVRTVYDHFAVMANDMKYQDTDSKRKMDKMAKKVLTEVASRVEGFGENAMIWGKKDRTGKVKMLTFNVKAFAQYIVLKLAGPESGDGEVVDDLDAYLDGAAPAQDAEANAGVDIPFQMANGEIAYSRARP